MSHLTRRRFSRRKAIQRPSAHKKGAKGGLGIHLRSAAPTTRVRCAPFHVTAKIASRHATPRHADLPYCAAQHLLRHGTLRIKALRNDPQGLDWAVQPHNVAQCAALVHPNALSIRLARRASPPSA